MKNLLLFLLCFAWHCTAYGQQSEKLTLLSKDSFNILKSEGDSLICQINSLNLEANIFSENYLASIDSEIFATIKQRSKWNLREGLLIVVSLAVLFGIWGYIVEAEPCLKTKIILSVVLGVISGIIYYFVFVTHEKANFFSKQYKEQLRIGIFEKKRIEEDALEFWAQKTNNQSEIENYSRMFARQNYIRNLLYRDLYVKDSIKRAEKKLEKIKAENLEKKKFNDWKMRNDVQKRLKIVRLYWDKDPDIVEKGTSEGNYSQKHFRYNGEASGKLVSNYTGRVVDRERHYLHLKLSDGSYLKINVRSKGYEKWMLAEVGDIVEYSKIFSSYQYFTECWKLL